MISRYSIFSFILLLLFQINGNGQRIDHLGYDLTTPTEKVKLPSQLTEISGLGISGDRIYMVQDEKGKIYDMPLLDVSNINETSFAKKGDYEGIEIVDNQIYVVKSNGNLYSSTIGAIDEELTVKTESHLKAKDNIEGLGYDPKTRSLLIASKDEAPEGNRCIYSLKVDELSGALVCIYEVNEQDLKKKLAENMGNIAFQMSLALSKDDYTFRPSAIAKHPISGDIYILSSPMHQLLVLSKKWQIQDLTFLPSKTFRQPEGIAFDGEGNLYISNEGRNKSGNILKFNYQK